MDKKNITFAGSTFGEPWWTLGEIVAKVLEPRGYKVKVTAQESGGTRNIRWVSSGKAELGPMTPVHLKQATNGFGVYEGEKFTNLASIATVQWPSWLGLAIRRETGCIDLLDVKKKKYPLRIIAREPYIEIILNHYNMSIKEIESWGGKLTPMRERAGYWRGGLGDMMLSHIYLGYTPATNVFHEATILYDMRFLDFDEALIEKLVEFGYMRSTMPHGIYRGVDRDIRCVGMDSMYIYCLKSQSAELVRDVVKGLDENSDLFQNTRSIFFYDRTKVWKNPYIPLHPAAEEYYHEKGYMK